MSPKRTNHLRSWSRWIDQGKTGLAIEPPQAGAIATGLAGPIGTGFSAAEPSQGL